MSSSNEAYAPCTVEQRIAFLDRDALVRRPQVWPLASVARDLRAPATSIGSARARGVVRSRCRPNAGVEEVRALQTCA